MPASRIVVAAAIRYMRARTSPPGAQQLAPVRVLVDVDLPTSEPLVEQPLRGGSVGRPRPTVGAADRPPHGDAAEDQQTPGDHHHQAHRQPATPARTAVPP